MWALTSVSRLTDHHVPEPLSPHTNSATVTLSVRICGRIRPLSVGDVSNAAQGGLYPDCCRVMVSLGRSAITIASAANSTKNSMHWFARNGRGQPWPRTAHYATGRAYWLIKLNAVSGPLRQADVYSVACMGDVVTLYSGQGILRPPYNCRRNVRVSLNAPKPRPQMQSTDTHLQHSKLKANARYLQPTHVTPCDIHDTLPFITFEQPDARVNTMPHVQAPRRKRIYRAARVSALTHV